MGRVSAQHGLMEAQELGDRAPATSGPSSPPAAAHEEENYGGCRVSLAFRSSAVEGEFLQGEASSRWRVLKLMAGFDCAMFVVRVAALLISGTAIGYSLLAQLANMALLYSLTALLNSRSRRLGSRAAHQEEALLCCLIATAISFLVLSLRPGNASDYVYAALFLTCTSSILKLRWFVGTIALAVPVAVAVTTNLRLRLAAAAPGTCAAADFGSAACMAAAAADAAAGGSAQLLQLVPVGPLPLEALVHILVAWAVGALMAFVADSNRRQSFVSHRQALGAAAKELAEVQSRVLMERELAAAQQQAAARALVVAKEKAANEAKSEFMSLMCHEVRTPLNGCLASAEMLLDTELDEDQRELAKTIRVSGSILLSTVSNFLDFFKIEAGKQLDIVRSPLDLQDLVTDVHCIIEAMVGRERGIALLPPDLDGAPATVLGDPSRICGILLNLYTNAAKYTKRGSIALRVRVVGRNYRPDPTVALSFCDSNGASASRTADSRASRSFLASMADTAPNTSGQSTPTGVLSGGPGGGGAGSSRAACGPSGGKPGSSAAHAAAAAAASRGGQHSLYGQGGRLGHDSAASLREASAASASAASDAAALLSRQAEAACAGVAHTIMSSVTEVDGWSSVHSQADPHFVMRHAPSQQCAPSPASGSGEEDEGEARFLCFEVMDTGVGVSHKALESLFKDYVQGTDAEMQRPRARGGTGLGLSICCKQVAVLGGAIGALSKPTCGSVFWFTTPLLLPPRNSSSSAGSPEESSEEEAAAAAAPRTAASHAAGAAAIRRSVDFAAAALVAPAPGGDGQSAVLPHGIPVGHHGVRPRNSCDMRGNGPRSSCDMRGDQRGGSGSRRQLMESNLSSMWPSHKLPPHHESSRGLHIMEEDASYHPRHALSWETAIQPPSFTAAEMLQAMPLLASPAGSGVARRFAAPATSAAGAQPAQPRRSLTGRPSLSGVGAQMGPAQPPGAMAAASGSSGAAAASASAAAAARQRQVSSLLGLRVLLAEDNLINQTVAKRVLTSLGCECRVASNGREAVMAVEEAAAGGAQFDVILMDMCMPVLGGVEATQEIRQLGCRVPIVAMTANVSERDRVECIASGMNGFLSKPVLKEQLSVAIREATQGGHRA